MNDRKPGWDRAFLDRQRERLLKQRQELLGAIHDAQTEEAGIHLQSLGEAHEAEDDAQRLETLDNEQNLIDRNSQRLEDTERALRKIEDGTYGLADGGGEPIPREKLEAVPEARR